MSETTAPRDTDVLQLSREPAALVSRDARLTAWNDEFAALIHTDALAPGTKLPAYGNRVACALENAFAGKIGIGQTLIGGEAGESLWMLLALPHTDDESLVMLSRDGELQRSFHDDLTGLPNRRDANARLVLEWKRMLRDDENCFSIAMVDVDHFKLVNDHFGHGVGDEVLVHLSQQLTESMRSGDWVARWGGEEFLLFMHQTGLVEASAVAERIRASIASKNLPSATGSEVKLTVCLGVVCSDSYVTLSNDSDDNLSRMINAADVLLYEAKRSGRNCVHSQMEGEKVFWNGKEMLQLLEGEDLRALPAPLTDSDGRRCGSYWDFDVRGEGSSAPKRVHRSAFKLNMSTKLDAALLSRINRINDPGEHGQALFVPISPTTLLDIENEPEFEKATASALANGVDLVFVVKDDEPLIREVSQDALEAINRRGISLCLQIDDSIDVPIGAVNRLGPRYVLLNDDVEADDEHWRDLTDLLSKHKVRAVLPHTLHERLAGMSPDILFAERA